MRPCLDCGRLTPKTRCPTCQAAKQSARNRRRAHYAGNYDARARAVRAAAYADPATRCWICQQPARPDDPWTADHVVATDPTSPLAPAHRSCNSRRGNRPHPG